MKAIVAMAENRVIGYGGKIPWHLPEDLQFFKESTWGKAIIMGRKTYESIGRPLPGRKNIVLTREKDKLIPGVLCVHDPQDLIPSLKGGDAFVIGGESIYGILLPFCNEILVTHVKSSPLGDTFFPVFEREFNKGTLLKENTQMKIVCYSRLHLLKK